MIVNLNFFTLESKTQVYGFKEIINGKNYFFIQPSVVQNILSKEGYNYRKTLKGFKERGYLLYEQTQNRYTVRRTNNTVTTTYIALLVEEDFTDLTEEEKIRIERREFDECSEIEWIEKRKTPRYVR